VTRATAFWDDSFLAHDPPSGEFEAAWTGRLAVREPHPDRPERLENVRHILEHELEAVLDWAPAPAATRAQLERVHDPSYVDEFEAFCAAGGGRLTAETGANEHSFEAARHAAGAAIAATEHALEYGLENVPYACVRPSGHHAQPAQADGFCFFNNAAVAAEHALATDAVERVAILDWDVHHGNGTQACFYDRDDVLVVSLHNDHWSWDPEAHPQTGELDEHGTGDGVGYTLNVSLPPGTGDAGYADAFDRIVDPVVTAFDPDLLVVSAGQDCGTIDPLGRNVVTKSGFEAMGGRARDLAATAATDRLVLLQEGGYQLSHLGYATLGVLEGVLGLESDVEDPFAWLDEDLESARRRIDDAVAYFEQWWRL
jgi:acetoin utilization deacetylase AcuC-like enzyme